MKKRKKKKHKHGKKMLNLKNNLQEAKEEKAISGGERIMMKRRNGD